MLKNKTIYSKEFNIRNPYFKIFDNDKKNKNNCNKLLLLKDPNNVDNQECNILK